MAELLLVVVCCVCAACCYHQLSIYAHVCKYLYYVMNEKCFVSKGAIFSIIRILLLPTTCVSRDCLLE